MKNNVENIHSEKHTILFHFKELRKRLLLSLLFFGAAFLLTYSFSQNIYDLLLIPLENIMKSTGGTNRVIFTNLSDGFMTYLKTAMFGAFFLSIPFILFQLWMFISPALYKEEKKFIVPMIFSSIFLFLIGTLLAYKIVVPTIWKFFLSFQTSAISNTIMPIELEAHMSHYFSLITKMITSFGLIFQLPIFIISFVKFKLVNVHTLRKGRKYFFLGSFVLGALLTPPDIISQMILAIPLYLLYELSISISKIISKNTRF